MALGTVKFALEQRDGETHKDVERFLGGLQRFEANIKGIFTKYDPEAAVSWKHESGIEIFEMECGALDSKEVYDLLQEEIDAQGLRDRVTYGPVGH